MLPEAPVQAAFCGQTFSSFFSVVNSSNYDLSNVTLTVAVRVGSRAADSGPLASKAAAEFPTGSSLGVVVRYPIRSLEKHNLVATATYTSFHGVERTLSRRYAISVIPALRIDARAHSLPCGDVLVEAQVTNECPVPLRISGAAMTTPAAFHADPVLSDAAFPSLAGACSSELAPPGPAPLPAGTDAAFASLAGAASAAAASAAAREDAACAALQPTLQPKEVWQSAFRLRRVSRDAQRAAGAGAVAVDAAELTRLGTVAVRWVAFAGESGETVSAEVVRVLPQKGDVHVTVEGPSTARVHEAVPVTVTVESRLASTASRLRLDVRGNVLVPSGKAETMLAPLAPREKRSLRVLLLPLLEGLHAADQISVANLDTRKRYSAKTFPHIEVAPVAPP